MGKLPIEQYTRKTAEERVHSRLRASRWFQRTAIVAGLLAGLYGGSRQLGSGLEEPIALSTGFTLGLTGVMEPDFAKRRCRNEVAMFAGNQAGADGPIRSVGQYVTLIDDNNWAVREQRDYSADERDVRIPGAIQSARAITPLLAPLSGLFAANGLTNEYISPELVTGSVSLGILSLLGCAELQILQERETDRLEGVYMQQIANIAGPMRFGSDAPQSALIDRTPAEKYNYGCSVGQQVGFFRTRDLEKQR